MKRYCVVSILSCLTCLSVAPAQTVNIPDANLRQAILEALGMPAGATITQDDMLQLTWLAAGNRGVASLTGLEHATNLRELWAQDNQITDLGPLADLTNLWKLGIWNNRVADISPLASLTGLLHLNIAVNQVSDVSALAGMHGLEELWAHDNQISDVGSLAGLTNLRKLGAWNNSIHDISALAGMHELEELNLNVNQITDISSLASMTKMRFLNLHNNQIKDISALSGMTLLEGLWAGGNGFSDISALSGKTQMTILHLWKNNINDISALGGMPLLVDLELDSNQIADISPLVHANKLERLIVWGNQISDLSPLTGLTGMRHLAVCGNPISDLSPVSGMTDMLRLAAQGTGISDISPLAGMEKLEGLWLGGNQISDISPFASMEMLRELVLDRNSIKDLSPLTQMTALGYLNVRSNPLGVDAYQVHIPQILANNPGIELLYDELDRSLEVLRISCYRGHTYCLLTQSDWPSAQMYAMSLGGYLCIVDGADENHWLYDTFSGEATARGGNCLWLGLLDEDNDGHWNWVDGSPVSYSNWASGQPNGGPRELYAGVLLPDPARSWWTANAGKWHDVRHPPHDHDHCLGVVEIDAIVAVDPNFPVFFRDPQLKACVEAHLGVTDPTSTDMLRLTELTCTGSGIFDLTGLEYAFNLAYLDLSGNQITDLSPLLGLTSLRVLNLAGNPLDADAYSTCLSLLRALNPGLELTHDIPLIAWSPEPVNGAVGVVSPVLRWKAGRTAAYHDLYFSHISTLGSRVLVGRLATTEYAISSSLVPGTTYYWRVDEVEANGTTIHKGPVWRFTAADPRTLTVSALPGGSVLTPGEGQFQIEKGTILAVEAAPADAAYEFFAWSGTAAENGKVEDVNVATTRVVVDANYTLEAVFVERADGPVLGFSVGEIAGDDPNEYYYRVATNNTPEATFVERVTGVEPDPNGMVRIQVVEEEPARAKGRFGRCSAARVLVRFEYLFETADATEIVVYLSDVPELLAHDDPSRLAHYVEIGRVPAPPEGCAGSFGSGRFGVFEEWAFVGGLNLSNGTWVELELASGAMLAGSPKSIQGSIRLAWGDPGGSAVFDSLSVQVHCSGYCLDLNFTKTVDSEDLLLVMAACGSTAELEEGGEGSRYCLDGVFSHDGYVDAHDIYSLIWALSDLTRVDCGSLCRVPLPLVNTSGGISAGGSPAGSSIESAAVGPWPTDLLVLYKSTRSDSYGLFDGEGAYVSDFTIAGLPTDSAAQIVRGVGDDVYVVSTEEGVLEIADPVRCVIPPAKIAYNSAMVYIGIQGQGPNSFGRPILDVGFDSQGYAYVVPVVVEPEDGEAYVCVAQLELLGGEDPPYRVVRLYNDPAPANDNRCRDYLREIEVDSAGNVYVLNAHRLNESCLLWKYGSDGTVLARLSLLDPGSPAKVADPVALHVSHDGKTLYLASGQQDQEHPGSVVLYGLSTEDLSPVRTVLIDGMPLATSLTEDPGSGALWVTGFRTTEEAGAFPWLPAVYTHTVLLAKVPAGVEAVEATEIPNATGAGSMLPVSILWTGAMQ